MLHAEADYTGAWLGLFDQIVRYGHTVTNADHPCLVEGALCNGPFAHSPLRHDEA